MKITRSYFFYYPIALFALFFYSETGVLSHNL